VYAIIRQYQGASALIDAIERKSDEAAGLMRAAPGFVAYYAVRTADGLTAVAVANDRAGAEATSQIASKFVRDNLSAEDAKSVGAPRISGGEVVIHA
jgi:hypothetical protein